MTDKKKPAKIIYISGPITGIRDYQENFNTAADLLIDKGYSVVNPARLNEIIAGTFSREQIMKIDLALLGACDGIFLLPGWEFSKGAKEERRRAKEIGLFEMEGIDV